MHQLFTNDCGISCIKMILASLNEDKNYFYLPFKEKSGNYSFQELVDFAKDYGLFLEGFKLKRKEDLFTCDTYPLIVSCQIEESHHAVVVTHINEKKVYYVDPIYGKRSVKRERFLEFFDGLGLLIKNFEKKMCPFLFEEKPSRIRQTVSFALQIVGTLCLVLGIYFVNKDSYIFLPIIFFALFVVFEVLLRSYLFASMQKLDDTFFKDVKVKKEHYYDFYERYEDYKKQIIAMPVTGIGNFLVSIILCLALLLNGRYNIALIMVVVMLILVDLIFFGPYLEKEKYRLQGLERLALNAFTNDDYIQLMDNLHKKSYRYGKIVLFKKYIYILVLLLTIILVMILNQIVSVPFIVLYLCMSYALYQNMFPIFNVESLERDLQISKGRFINILHQNDEIDE